MKYKDVKLPYIKTVNMETTQPETLPDSKKQISPLTAELNNEPKSRNLAISKNKSLHIMDNTFNSKTVLELKMDISEIQDDSPKSNDSLKHSLPIQTNKNK